MKPAIPSVPNLRDVGGRRTGDGREFRTGLLFRSDQIGCPPEEDVRAIARLGLRYVYDLRTEAERAMFPGDPIPGATHVTLDVLADDRQSAPALLLRLVSDPGSAQAMLGDGRAVAMFMDSYRSFVRLDSARAGYRRLYEGLADAGRLPAMFHCTTGKDRTGWACAALQMVLGVPYEAVVEDYLESNRRILPKYQPHLSAFAAKGGDPEVLMPVLSVRPEYLEVAVQEACREYGSIEGYFRAGLGLDDATLDALHARFVT